MLSNLPNKTGSVTKSHYFLQDLMNFFYFYFIFDIAGPSSNRSAAMWNGLHKCCNRTAEDRAGSEQWDCEGWAWCWSNKVKSNLHYKLPIIQLQQVKAEFNWGTELLNFFPLKWCSVTIFSFLVLINLYLVQEEKEERRIRRILANRESARQTIRRRQVSWCYSTYCISKFYFILFFSGSF